MTVPKQSEDASVNPEEQFVDESSNKGNHDKSTVLTKFDIDMNVVKEYENKTWRTI